MAITGILVFAFRKLEARIPAAIGIGAAMARTPSTPERCDRTRHALCERARRSAAGASARTCALSLAQSAVAAEADGPASGRAGAFHRLSRRARSRPHRRQGRCPTSPGRRSAIILSDAKGGAAHPGFDAAFDDLVEAAQLFGVAIFSQKNAYTCGALGYFAGRLAGKRAGLRSPPPTARRCLPAPARQSRSTAPTRWPSPRRSPADRR